MSFCYFFKKLLRGGGGITVQEMVRIMVTLDSFQVDLTLLLAARDQELRTVSAEVILRFT